MEDYGSGESAVTYELMGPVLEWELIRMGTVNVDIGDMDAQSVATVVLIALAEDLTLVLILIVILTLFQMPIPILSKDPSFIRIFNLILLKPNLNANPR